MKNAFKFITKAFFGGCFGCLGAWITTVLLVVLLGAIFATTIGPGLISSITGFTQSIPSLIGNTIQGAFGGGNEGGEPNSLQAGMHFTNLVCPNNPPPELKVFITSANDPTAEHLTQILSEQATADHFWVQSPQGVTVKFGLVLTTPDGKTRIWGPSDDTIFTSDPGGLPFSVGSFGSPVPTGQYQITIYLCDTVTAGSLSFQVIP
jgi:hypothetical protein